MDQPGKFYLGHLGKVPVFIGWEALFLVWFIWNQYRDAGTELMLIGMAAVLLTILMHELGHALVARVKGMFGVTITISALGGYCSYQGDPKPWDKVLITSAGPAMNFFLAGLAWLILRYDIFAVPQVLAFVHAMLIWNLTLGIFNIFPLFPLDGGQIAHSLLRIGTRSTATANRATLALSVASAFVLVGLSAYLNHGEPSFFMIGLVLLMLFTAFHALR
jgi:stage IV sporulation protein FB